jgi:hypothetical protein
LLSFLYSQPRKKAAAPEAPVMPQVGDSSFPSVPRRPTKSSTSIREGQGKQPKLLPYFTDLDTCEDCSKKAPFLRGPRLDLIRLMPIALFGAD